MPTSADDVKSEEPKFKPAMLNVADEHVGRLLNRNSVTDGESNVYVSGSVPMLAATVTRTERPLPALVPVAHMSRVLALQARVVHVAYKAPYKAADAVTSNAPKFAPNSVKLEPKHVGPFVGVLTVNTGASKEKVPAEVPTTPAMLTPIAENPWLGGMTHVSCVNVDHCVVMQTREPNAMVGVWSLERRLKPWDCSERPAVVAALY